MLVLHGHVTPIKEAAATSAPHLITGPSPVVPATNPTAEIRSLGELPDATVEAGERLLRSSLRRHLLARAAAIERGDRHHDQLGVYDLVLDAETTIEVEAEAAWRATLGIWINRWEYDAPRRWLRACLQLALAGAVEASAGVITEWFARYPPDEVNGWVEEFVVSVRRDPPLSVDVTTAHDRPGHAPAVQRPGHGTFRA